ncbi:hypothetical protein WMF39_28260 [Sorangium sp. So ce1504]|uniref:hypothetical protein n=1 Tax=Sorangium sp. So ce1504 TaxID=3133337 RepID=UPI003F63B3E8
MQFKHHLGVELAGDKETMFLIGERERTMLRGRDVHLLGPLARLTLVFGCHHDARLGVQRAPTELNQLFDPRVPAPARGWDRADLAGEAYLFPDDGALARALGDYPAVRRDDLRDDVMYFCDFASLR